MARVPGGSAPGGTGPMGGGRVPASTPPTSTSHPKAPAAVKVESGKAPVISQPSIPTEAKKSLNVMLSEIAEGQLQYSLQRIRNFVTQSHLSELTPTGITGNGKATDCILQPYTPSANVAIYQLCALYYDENESIYEKITSIYTALNMINAAVAIILRGNADGCNVYMAVTTGLSANEVLANSVEGLFPGSIMKPMGRSTKIPDIIGSNCKFIQSVAFTPARRQTEVSRETVYSSQGLEKIVEALRGKDYTIVLLATGMCGDDLQNRSLGLERLGTMISSFEKQSHTITNASNASTALSESKTFSDSVSETLGASYGTNHGNSKTHGKGSTHGHTTSFFGVGFSRAILRMQLQLARVLPPVVRKLGERFIRQA